MTFAEWKRIASEMTAMWPKGRIAERAGQRYFADLAELPEPTVRAAVEVLYREGREWPPTGAQIRAKVAELTIDAPDWSEALAQIGLWHRRPQVERMPCAECDDTGWLSEPDLAVRCGCEVRQQGTIRAQVDEQRRRVHPIVRIFVESYPDQVAPMVYAEEATAQRVNEAQVREKWEAFVRRGEREMCLAGIEPAGLPTLERIAGKRAGRLAPVGEVVKGLLAEGSG